jgi:addiction module HigA family antidote
MEKSGQPTQRNQAPSGPAGNGHLLDEISPGEILLEEFMKPSGLSRAELARRTGLSASLVSKIVSGNSSITSNSAAKLAGYFSTSPAMWLNLQQEYRKRLARSQI